MDTLCALSVGSIESPNLQLLHIDVHLLLRALSVDCETCVFEDPLEGLILPDPRVRLLHMFRVLRQHLVLNEDQGLADLLFILETPILREHLLELGEQSNCSIVVNIAETVP